VQLFFHRSVPETKDRKDDGESSFVTHTKKERKRVWVRSESFWTFFQELIKMKRERESQTEARNGVSLEPHSMDESKEFFVSIP